MPEGTARSLRDQSTEVKERWHKGMLDLSAGFGIVCVEDCISHR